MVIEGKKLTNKSKTLEVGFLNEENIEIESGNLKNIGVRVQKLDPTDVRMPTQVRGAVYRIQIYVPEDGTIPFEYDVAFVMPDGKILSRSASYLKKKANPTVRG